MGFFDWLERQRARPEAERRALTFLFAGAITGAVVLVWASTLFVGSGTTEQTTERPELIRQEEEFRQGVASLSERYSSLKETIGSLFSDEIRYESQSPATTSRGREIELVAATSTATSTAPQAPAPAQAPTSTATSTNTE